MKTSPLPRVAAALALAAALFGAAPLLAQGAPVAGAIHLALTPSSSTPKAGSTFTVDLSIDMTAATGTCTGPTVVPVTLGAYSLGIRYDSTQLGFVSTAACPSAPAEFSAAPSCVDNTGSPAASFVNCNAVNASAGLAVTTPQGNVCVLRLTFRNLTAAAGSPASLVTLHTGGARGIATGNIAGCGGPVSFPAGSAPDGTGPLLTPSEVVLFPAD